MTQREQELYDIIRENPSISQNEIAQKMNISRSAVSVHLNELYKKKILLGRGYILNELKHPVCIGPAHVDIRSIMSSKAMASSGAHSSAGTYASSRTQIRYGGSAKSIMDYLYNFVQHPRAILALGDDDLGDSFIRAGIDMNISPSDYIVVPGAPTAVYTELVDEDMNLIFSFHNGFYKMAEITPLDISVHANVLDTASMFIIHDSVPTDVVRFLYRTYPEVPLFLIGSANHFMDAARDVLNYFSDALFSVEVASSLVWKEKVIGTSLEGLLDISSRLVNLGMTHFHLMADPYTLLYCDGNAITIHTSPNPGYPERTNFPHYYSDCRDVMSAVICYQMLNSDKDIPLLDYLAAARNLVNSRALYFDRSISLPLLKDTAATIKSRVTTYSL